MNTIHYSHKHSYWLASALFMSSIGLAQAQETQSVQPSSDGVALTVANDESEVYDPFEKFNRAMYDSNTVIDKYTLGPVSRGYSKVVPKPIQSCVTNFFQNLSVPYTAVNNLLQGKFKAAGQDVCRFVINSTVGLGGCIDVASKAKIPKHNEDFGQTLGKWGVKPGAYVMLPLLGPSNIRDTLAMPVDFFANPLGYKKFIKIRNYTTLLKVVDTRVQLQGTLDLIDEVALDKYAFSRDAWSQKREADVSDVDDFEGFDESASISIGDAQVIAEVTIQAPTVSTQRVEQAAQPVVEPVIHLIDEKITL
ncbi:lipoprotein [Formosimonas limnophila]|uniref:Lipoprotein n=2 Tax=Formosimonas limnophila TaxID=1384487 RepID=A0A8J3FZV0_9BURK|nr:lipoprotein [Formosimonas limnophila]